MSAAELTDAQKWEFLRTVPAEDIWASARLRTVAAQARALGLCIAALRGEAQWEWPTAHVCHCIARDMVAYVTDTARVGREQIDGLTDPEPPSRAACLERGTDDCDAKARLFVALCIGAGLEAEMVPRWEHGRLVHVYARVRLPAGQGRKWFDVETILQRARIGDVPEDVPHEQRTGLWLYSQPFGAER